MLFDRESNDLLGVGAAEGKLVFAWSQQLEAASSTHFACVFDNLALTLCGRGWIGG
jgi:hypothetical protein